jgi:hypothetical protein
MWRRVVWCVFTDVSKEPTLTIFRLENMETAGFVRDVDVSVQDCTASYPSRLVNLIFTGTKSLSHMFLPTYFSIGESGKRNVTIESRGLDPSCIHVIWASCNPNIVCGFTQWIQTVASNRPRHLSRKSFHTFLLLRAEIVDDYGAIVSRDCSSSHFKSS